MRTILLATDGSPSAARATDEAIELALETGRQLHVVTAWHIPVTAGYGYMAYSIPGEIIDAEREHAQSVLAAAIEKAEQAGVEATGELREGAAGDEICDAAATTGASTIVVGAHGWGSVKRVLFGSVSTDVLHRAPCPVLVVRAPASDAADAEASTTRTTAAAR